MGGAALGQAPAQLLMVTEFQVPAQSEKGGLSSKRIRSHIGSLEAGLMTRSFPGGPAGLTPRHCLDPRALSRPSCKLPQSHQLLISIPGGAPTPMQGHPTQLLDPGAPHPHTHHLPHPQTASGKAGARFGRDKGQWPLPFFLF